MPKSYHQQDPFFDREQDRYDHPVPSREYIQQFMEQWGKPVDFKSLYKNFGLTTSAEKLGLKRRLKAMLRDGQLMSNRRGYYALAKAMAMVAGRIVAHRDGFGFLIPDDGTEDVFLPARQMRGVFTDDRALVRISETSRRRKEGVIVEVLERNTQHIVGRYYEDGGVAFVEPDGKRNNQSIIIPKQERHKAKVKQFVVVEIVSQPNERHQATGKIIDILGDHLTPGMEVELAVRAHDIPFAWSTQVKRETAKLPKIVDAAEYAGRLDLRDLAFVTIDGEDAKDFDDAVYCQPLTAGGWQLYVAIADVTHYVKPGMALDTEALSRGNSVYFPNKVIPMLPEQLSNNLCSLKPNCDRLVTVCDMQISAQGVVKQYQFREAVIHSQARLTYTLVSQMLAGDEVSIEAKLKQPLHELHQLFLALFAERQKRGAIEFDTLETKIEFDDKGKIKCIFPVKRNIAHLIIEECMLSANVCAADFLLKNKLPGLFRVHESPSVEKIMALQDFLSAFGLKLQGDMTPHAKNYCELLAKIADRIDAHLLQTVMLRSLQQAHYSPSNKGHFGLAYDHYTHFTSPIRRYPDLLVHRAIKRQLKSKDIVGCTYTEEQMQSFGAHCSMTERRADWATRDAVDWLKCEYLLDKVGETFVGYIVEVTGFGLFVELKDIYVQGLVHITSLENDYYEFDATHHLLRGTKAGKTFQLGDAIEVTVSRVDLDERLIDFVPVGFIHKNTKKKVRAGKGKSRSNAKTKSSKGEKNKKQVSKGKRSSKRRTSRKRNK